MAEDSCGHVLWIGAATQGCPGRNRGSVEMMRVFYRDEKLIVKHNVLCVVSK
jgi:hypothetical protein